MSDLETKIRQITSLYSKLKKSQNGQQKQRICKQTLVLCVQVEQLLQKSNKDNEKFRWTRQIADIKDKILQVEHQIKNTKNKKRESEKKIQGKITQVHEINQDKKNKQLQEQVEKKVVRTILYQQLNHKQMSVAPQQLQELAKKMQQNLQVMEEIKKLINQQSNDLDQIEQKIKKAYEQTQQGNKLLQEAANTQLRTRLRKIRLGVTGILGSIGFVLMGIPGAILGLVGGLSFLKSKKVSK